jgi:hypothetical protein
LRSGEHSGRYRGSAPRASIAFSAPATPRRRRANAQSGQVPQYRTFDPTEENGRCARPVTVNRVWAILKVALNRALEQGKVASDAEKRNDFQV